MVVVQWDPVLALGHAEDRRAAHGELFRRFGALVAAMERGEPEEIGELFDFLGDYVVKHFAAEEQVMARAAYPGANVHAAAHARFVREYKERRALFDSAGATRGVAVKTETWMAAGWRRTSREWIRSLARFLRRD